MFQPKLARRGWTLRRLLFSDTDTTNYRNHAAALNPEVCRTHSPSQLPPVEVDPVLAERLFGPNKKASSGGFSIPAGIHEYAVFSRALANEEPFTGIVAHISVHPAATYVKMPRQVPVFLESLLEESDFGCHIAENEFLMICPGPRGDEARRRWETVCERLWSFQLDLKDASTISFSWGGAQARDERLLDAVTSATERMLQTKHHRKTVFLDVVPNKRVV